MLDSGCTKGRIQSRCPGLPRLVGVQMIPIRSRHRNSTGLSGQEQNPVREPRGAWWQTASRGPAGCWGACRAPRGPLRQRRRIASGRRLGGCRHCVGLGKPEPGRPWHEAGRALGSNRTRWRAQQLHFSGVRPEEQFGRNCWLPRPEPLLASEHALVPDVTYRSRCQSGRPTPPWVWLTVGHHT